MALFDLSASTYDSWCSTEIGSFVDHLEKDVIFQLALPQKGECALDLGCGTGIYSIWLARMGLKVTGIDTSLNMLEIAKEKSAAASLDIDFIQADIHQLPFADETFDLIVGNIVLEFVDEPQQVMKEVFRVLKKGGRFVCGFIGKDSSWGKKYQKQGQEKAESVFANANFFSPETVRNLFSFPVDKIQLGLFFADDEFVNCTQAATIERDRLKQAIEKDAGYFAVRWKKLK
ncbi:class I SAM-dependent methyltransferase [Bacillota bacterium Lsc_1132]